MATAASASRVECGNEVLAGCIREFSPAAPRGKPFSRADAPLSYTWLDNGVIQQVGSPISLYDYPANTAVARAVGQWNLLTGFARSRQGGALLLDVKDVGELRVPLRPDTPAASRFSIGFRPHAVKIGGQDDVHDARYTWLEGMVENLESWAGPSATECA